jgi:glycosyltransferase involved in cell wall biosynthesis
MHIGIDCRLPTYQMGGISRYVLHLLTALAEYDQEHRYTVFHSRKETRDYRPDAPNFFSARLWTPCHHRWERRALALELARHRLDVFHSPDFIPPAGGARRRVITVHDLNFLYYPQFLTAESHRYYNGQIDWAVQQAQHIAADSEHTRQDLIDRLNVPPEKVTTVPLAAHPDFTRPVAADAVAAVLAQHGLPPGFILFVGTLEPRKNVPGLLRAYDLLRREHGLDVPLVLVGSKGWLYDDIFSTIAEMGLAGRVRHLSGLTNRELAALYHAAGLLALPSYYEGFGFPPLEAMHGGCPVLVSNHSSLPELVGPAGWLLDPDDAPAWAAAMATVLQDSEQRKEMIAAGREQAQKFTWSRVARQMVAIYTSTS